MNNKRLITTAMMICVFFWTAISGNAVDLMRPIPLIKPQMDSGRLLMNVLKERKSSRDFSDKKLPIRVLSNLLWAADGINRPPSGKRTAPSAMNWHEIDIYVATEQGLYLYDAQYHRLTPVLAQDIRVHTGTQPFVGDAPVNLIYVANLTKMGAIAKESKDFYSALDTGVIAQNVNLYCASEGLATVMRGMINREHLAQIMKLGPEQQIILAQTVGYPRK